MAQFLKINALNPDPRKIKQVVEVLLAGGLVIYPTDTIYGLGCDIFNSKALEKVKRLKGMKGKSLPLSFICADLSDLSVYARQVDTPVFKLMKKVLPGPYTFILNASAKVPKIFQTNKKMVGIRVPDNNIPRAIVTALGHPIITTSIHEDDVRNYATDPEEIRASFDKVVDVIIDGGYGQLIPSTIIDCTEGEPKVVREGAGSLDGLLV